MSVAPSTGTPLDYVNTGVNVLSALAGRQSKPDYTHLKQGIQWRVADAKAAGIHPLFAMGANISSPSIVAGDNRASNALEQAGRGIQRASQNQIQRQQIALQSEESLARTNLLKSQTATSDYALLAAKDSANALNRTNLNSQNDIEQVQNVDGIPHEIKKPQHTPRLSLNSDIQTWEDKYGELISMPVGVIKAVNDAGRAWYQSLSDAPLSKGSHGRHKKQYLAKQKVRAIIQKEYARQGIYHKYYNPR